jgi:hypothetical protein
MKRRIGWVVLGFLWMGVALRMIFPLHLAHSGYPTVLSLLLGSVDVLLMMPPMFLLAMLAPSSEAWGYVASTGVPSLPICMRHWCAGV